MDPSSFLKAIWGEQTGFAEIRSIAQNKQVESSFFLYPAGLDKAISHALARRVANVYFGVGIRSQKRGDSASVGGINCVWVDIDFKRTDEATALKRLGELPTRPSATVSSGGGLHAYWLLKEPVTGDYARLRAVNRSIVKAVGGDPAACDPARIMRVPGTANVKYEPPRPCSLSSLKLDQVYNLSDFDYLPPADELVEAQSKEVAGKIGPGDRNPAMMSLAGSMARRGLTIDEMLPTLSAVNDSRCSPPLDLDELKQVAGNASKYPAAEPLVTRASSLSDGLHANDLLTMELPPIDYAIKPLFSRGNLTLIQGEPKGGKSCFALYLSILSALGVSIHDRLEISKPRRTVFVTWEDGVRRLQERLDAYLRGLGTELAPSDLIIYPHHVAPIIRLNQQGGPELMRSIIERYSAELVIFDTISHLHSAEENSKKEMQPVMDHLKDTARDYQCCIGAIHHTGKPSKESGRSMVYKSRGSSVIAAAPDIILDWGERAGNVTACEVASKDDGSDKFNVVYSPQDDGAIKWSIEDAEESSIKALDTLKIVKAIEEGLKTAPEGVGAQFISTVTSIHKRTVQRRCKEAVASGQLLMSTKGQIKLYLTPKKTATV